MDQIKENNGKNINIIRRFKIYIMKIDLYIYIFIYSYLYIKIIQIKNVLIV